VTYGIDFLLLPVPMWLFLLVTITLVVVVDRRLRLLRNSNDQLVRVINNMDRWADEIEEKLENSEKSSSRYVSGYTHFGSSERFRD
jgi:tRNA(Phe) wybutosine-synthesizing methylase Tyw3